MTKRTITDEEIALIKAMLDKKMKNNDIQFFFNKPDRKVNSGRITSIRNGSYSDSASIPAATAKALEHFLSHSASNSSLSKSPDEPLDPLSATLVQSLFSKNAEGNWKLNSEESDVHECKENFGLKSAGKWLRAVAALANNRGGYIFFGVRDKDTVKKDGIDLSYVVTGLNGDAFEKADTAEIATLIKGQFDPTPRFKRGIVEVGGKNIGVLYVDRHKSRPVISTKQTDEAIREGDVFYRYPAQSSRIKYSDFRSMLDERDGTAREQMRTMIERLLAIGPASAFIADLASGSLMDGNLSLKLDEQLASSLKFIKEGEFDEIAGSPTLKIVGTVEQGTPVTVFKKGVLTQAGLLEDFLDDTLTADCLDSIKFALESTQTIWSPVHYFVHKAGLDDKDVTAIIDGSSATPYRKLAFSHRFSGKAGAYRKPLGKALTKLHQILAGASTHVTSLQDVKVIAAAIMGLPASASIDRKVIASLLNNCIAIWKKEASSASMSEIRRAICRVDEILYRKA